MLKSAITTLGIAAVALGSAGVAEARTQIRIVGSSTVYPFTTAVAESFKRSYPQFQAPIVESTGTGAGVKLFCAGVGQQHPDFVNASRRLKASEAKTCAENGVTGILELQIGLDGLVIAQARGGQFVSLSEVDVYKALAANPFGGGKNKAQTWKDVNPKLPNIKISVIGPPPTSGTRDSFKDLYMIKGCESNAAMPALKKADEAKYNLACGKIREDGAYIEGGENDNLIVQKIAANPNVLGIFGFSFLEENGDKIKDVPINGIAATYDTISSFKYPASRPLFIYAKLQHMRAVKGMKEFLTEYTKESVWGPGGMLAKRGLVAEPTAVRAKNAAIVQNMTPLDISTLK
ncbi:substrate-binding domain-containing protein [Polymorphobacter arshaanensis]|uniref:substrate-binding domain-containing protein n=1 Tax=Glacieibacterium arshaanense TaxID=2511025 RepID=UPI001FB18397|nr:substrate-binding domain-containing protein [Polymorphobacter arshaanensis]